MPVESPAGELGWRAEPFSLSDPDGNSVGLDELLGANGLLIAFICNHCPYVKAVIDRLAADARALQVEGIKVVAIMPNDYQRYPADAPERMREFASQHSFSFPYLIDEDQSVARAYGAVCTPDCFGFTGEGVLQYRGRLDDARMGDASNRSPELLNAMKQIARTGTGPEKQHSSMGCSIKWR